MDKNYAYCDECEKYIDNPRYHFFDDIGHSYTCRSCKMECGWVGGLELLRLYKGREDELDIYDELYEYWGDILDDE